MWMRSHCKNVHKQEEELAKWKETYTHTTQTFTPIAYSSSMRWTWWAFSIIANDKYKQWSSKTNPYIILFRCHYTPLYTHSVIKLSAINTSYTVALKVTHCFTLTAHCVTLTVHHVTFTAHCVTLTAHSLTLTAHSLTLTTNRITLT